MERFSPIRCLILIAYIKLLCLSSINSYASIDVDASDHDGHIPENTLDRNLNSRWSAEGDGQWILYDLGEVKKIKNINIAFYRGDQRIAFFDILVANQPNDFKQILSDQSNGSSLELQRFDLDSIEGRYLKIVGHGNSHNSWNSLTEVEINFEALNNTPDSGSETSKKFPIITASSHDGNIPINTMDKDFETRWSADGEGEWIEYDLGAVKPVKSIDISFFRGDQRSAQFDIQTSPNQTDYQLVYSGQSNGTTLGFQRFSFEATEARFIKITGYGNSQNSWNSLTEVSIQVDEITNPTDGKSNPPTAGGKYNRLGIEQHYPQKPGSVEWDSSHWKKHNSYMLKGFDPHDPLGWSQKRGNGNLKVHVENGMGVLTLSGSQPRIYINSYKDSKGNALKGRPAPHQAEQFFLNTETTAYYRRSGSDGANWGGLVIGARSGPNGHSSYGDYCDASTYYARIRHDGKWDFEKELRHPGASYSIGNIDSNGLLIKEHGKFVEGRLNSNQWYGVKFVIFNPQDYSDKVKLELYIDIVEPGKLPGEDQNWQLLGSLIDEGNWPVLGNYDQCTSPKIHSKHTITQGGGVVFIRNTGIEKAEYTKFSVREIAPPPL